MIEKFFQILIKELGPTGLLVLGLYWALGRPLSSISSSLRTINHEIGEIIRLLISLEAKKNG